MPTPHGSPALPQVELEIVRGAAQRRRRTVQPPVFMIGTAHDSDLVLGDPLFPELHCYLLVTAAGVTARRVGVGPKLLHNGLELEFVRCADGDRLTLGPYEFLLHIEGGSDEGEGGDRPRLRTFDADTLDFDVAWQHTHMLLCDIPAPLRPLAVPQQAPLPRRAIA